MSDSAPPADHDAVAGPPGSGGLRPIVEAAPDAPIPWFGLLAVLLGTFISTLNGRLSTFGLADIRGALHVGFDEGAWITSALTTAQMLIAPVAIWVGGVFGPRRALLAAATAFAVTSLLTPYAPNLGLFLALQFAGGLASGFFVPLTLSFILRNTPPKYWPFGVALYALNLELSLNISASLEGWYVDHLSWRWIFWQNTPLALAMALCLRFGVRPDPATPNRPPADLYGLAAGGIGLALIYAGLDQGNRLDWLHSGTIVALLLSGAVLVAGFFVHELRTRHPGLDLRVVFSPPIPRLLVLIGFLRLTILSTAFLIPQFLQAVRGFRALEVGETLVWIAAPQLVICPLAAVLLRRTDARIVACIGLILVAIACLMVAHGLTPLWGSEQFLPSQLLQAVGQSFALSGILFFAVLHLRPQDALSFGGAIQTARLMGGEIGQAFVATFTRMRTQTASNMIGQHVQIGDPLVQQRLGAYAAAASRVAADPAAARARGTAVLAGVIRTDAATQGVIDSFVALGALTAIALMLLVAHKPAPEGPASHISLFPWRRREAAS